MTETSIEMLVAWTRVVTEEMMRVLGFWIFIECRVQRISLLDM
jgi:hypothetical protein